MGWVYLIAAILLEVGGTVSMKASEGFTHWAPSVATFALYGLCLAALTFAINKIDLGTVYAVWAGLGTALVAVIGIVYYGEPVTVTRLVSIGLIIAGVAGLNLSLLAQR